jgi:hypothetical protein
MDCIALNALAARYAFKRRSPTSDAIQGKGTQLKTARGVVQRAVGFASG